MEKEIFPGIAEEILATSSRQKQLDERLDSLLERRKDLQSKVAAATSFPIPELSISRDAAQQLAIKVSLSSIAAHELSQKVKGLDTAQSRLHEALRRVDRILDLKTTIHNVQSALKTGDFEAAASGTFRVISLHSEDHSDVSREVLVSLENKVRTEIMAKYAASENQKDWPSVLRFSLLFPSVGQPFKGLETHCRVLRHLLSAKLHNQGLSLKSQPAGAVTQYLDLLSKILDQIALTVQEHSRNIQENFCRGAELRLLQELHHETDNQVTGLLLGFMDRKKLKQTVASIKKNEDDHDIIDPRQLDALLDDMSFLSRECEGFDTNIRKAASASAAALLDLSSSASDTLAEESLTVSTVAERRARLVGVRARSIVEGITKDTSFGESLGLELVHCSKVNKVVQEVVNYYTALEAYFMKQNIRKALDIDEHTGGDASKPLVDKNSRSDLSGAEHGLGRFSKRLSLLFKTSLTSTVVDDVFYILKKCAERAFNTSGANPACAIVNHVNIILSGTYIDHLMQRLVRWNKKWSNLGGGNPAISINSSNISLMGLYGGGSSSGGAMAESQQMVEDKTMLVAMNNFAVSIQHMLTLKRHLDGEFHKNFVDEETKKILKPSLDGLSETSQLFDKALKKGTTMLSHSIQPSILGALDLFRDSDYELNEADFADREIEDPFIPQLLATLRNEIQPLKACLHEKCSELLLGNLVQTIVERFSRHILSKKFTFWGGLQLDKDVRQLSGFFATVCVHTVRDKFSRLIQIASILQLDKASEINHYWSGQADGLWKLEAKEVMEVLRLRSDFSERELSALKL